MSILDAKVPAGPIEKKWSEHKDHIRLVNPANKRRIDVIVVGTGLAGASAAASLAEMGYNVKAFCFQDSSCLLYTSDAADERSSVDLGGRRTVKKKKKQKKDDHSEKYIAETK